MRRILITNDDGILADGLVRLAAAAAAWGEVWVVAPDGQRSGASHSVTLHAPVDVYPRPFPVPGVRAYACTGHSADCVRVACRYIMPGKPDVALSGVNYGFNAATDLQYSATAGAAFEAAFQGVRAIALSERADSDHAVTDAYLSETLRRYIDIPPARDRILNVNFPGGLLQACRGFIEDRIPSPGTFFDDDYALVEPLAEGGMRLKVDGHYQEKGEPGTDLRAIIDGYISVGWVRNVGGVR